LRLLLLTGVLVGVLSFSSAHAEAVPELRAQFQRAMQSPDDDRADSEALQGYVLYPYVQAARLQRALADSSTPEPDARIRAFIAEHADAPYVRSLRTAWWLSLYRRQHWADYLAAVGDQPSDPLLACQWLDAHLRLQRMEGFRERALETWMSGRDMPAACNDSFAWLRERGELTEARIEQRLRLAINGHQFGLARYLIRQLPDDDQRIWTNAILVREQRQHFIERLISNPDAPVPFEDLHAGFFRYARGNSEPARALLDRLLKAREFNAAEVSQFKRASALALAYSRDTSALPLFRTLDGESRDADALEWHARIALWAGEWREARGVILSMPPELRGHARWRYWEARITEQLGDQRAARQMYLALSADERNYYGFLAATRAGVKPRLDPVRAPVDPSAQAQLADLPAVQRARELLALEMRGEGMAELRWAFADLGATDKIQVAIMLDRWGWHDQAIVWLAEAQYWDDLWLRFPLPFREEFRAAAREAGIPEVWLYTIARTESLFNPRALSPVGARGIAQVMPATATATARRADIPYRGGDALYDVDINLRLGAAYIAQMLERFGDRWLFAVPAYNAGPGRIPNWLPSVTMEPDVWIENIPFNETRGYIQRALYHRVIIGWRLSGEVENLSEWLGPVPPDLAERQQ
jgi:soluble lytic murein transglycosylase